MNKQKLLRITRALLQQPTAPFHEQQVRTEIEAHLAGCECVQLKRDSFGNLIARYRRGKTRARWAFAAHMDHPGWVRGKTGNRKPETGKVFGEFVFFGGVPMSYLAK